MAHSSNNYYPDLGKVLRNDIKDLSSLDGRTLATWAKDTAEMLVKSDRLKTHQLRNVYASIEHLRTIYIKERKVTDDMRDGLFLLMPKLAYAAGRQRSVNATLFPFMDLLIKAIPDQGNDNEEKAFRNFFALIESVVGYHKYFENNRTA